MEMVLRAEKMRPATTIRRLPNLSLSAPLKPLPTSPATEKMASKYASLSHADVELLRNVEGEEGKDEGRPYAIDEGRPNEYPVILRELVIGFSYLNHINQRKDGFTNSFPELSFSTLHT
jgi:hypothetical protein